MKDWDEEGHVGHVGNDKDDCMGVEYGVEGPLKGFKAASFFFAALFLFLDLKGDALEPNVEDLRLD